jgi:hypothetical protein
VKHLDTKRNTRKRYIAPELPEHAYSEYGGSRGCGSQDHSKEEFVENLDTVMETIRQLVLCVHPYGTLAKIS